MKRFFWFKFDFTEQGTREHKTENNERERKLRKYYLYTESNNSSMSIIRTGLDWIGPVLR